VSLYLCVCVCVCVSVYLCVLICYIYIYIYIYVSCTLRLRGAQAAVFRSHGSDMFEAGAAWRGDSARVESVAM